ncbi:hypothetical protein UPYG_G00166770 [Umbra pygmaea]|uniref:Uncharacterized protein n=1 Tax=Umbra pygmaea TaxID=75934 RepID=A0ABD0WNK7_UMBPY
MSDKKSRKMRMGSSRRRPRNLNDNETENDGDGSELLSEESKGVKLLTDLVSMTPPMDPVSSDQLPSITTQFMDDNSNSSVNDFPDSQLFQTRNPNLLESPVTTGKRKKMGSTRRNRENQEDRDCGEKQDKESGDTEKSLELQASILTLGVSVSHSNMEQRLSPRESEEDTENRSQIGQGFTAESTTQPQQESEQTEAEYFFNNSRHSSDYLFESDASTITEDFETCNNTIVSQTEDDEEKLQPVINESEVHDDINSTEPEESAFLEPHNAGKRKKMGSTRSRTPRGIQREERPESWQEEVKEDTEAIGEVEKIIIEETTESLELKQHEEKVTDDLMIVQSFVSLEESACLDPHNAKRRKKMGSTRNRKPQGKHREERLESWQDEVKEDAEVIEEVEQVIIEETTEPLELKQHEEKVTDDLMIDLTSVQSFVGLEESACLEPHNAGKRKKMGSTCSRKPRGIHTEEKPESWQEEVKDDAEVIGEVEKVIIKETTEPLELKQHEEKVTEDLVIDESACLEPHNAGKRKKMGSTRSRTPRGIHTEEKPESWQEEVKDDAEVIGEVEKVIIKETTVPLELKQHEEKVTDDLMIVQSFDGPEEIACLESHNAGKRKKMGSTRSRTPRGIQREERPESWQEEVKEDTEAIGEVEKIIIEETTESPELKQHEEKVKDDLMIVQSFVSLEESACLEPHNTKRRKKMGSTRSRKPQGKHREERLESWQDEVKEDAEVIGEVEQVIIEETTEPLELKQHEEKVTDDLMIEESAFLEPHNAGKRKKMGSTRSRTPRGIQREERPESWQEEVKEDTEAIGEVEKIIIEETTESLELKQHEEKVTDDLMIGEAARIAVESDLEPLPPSNKPTEDTLLEKTCEGSRDNTDFPTDLTSVQSFVGLEESACLEPHNAGKRKKMGSTRSRNPRGIHTEEKPESWQEEVKDDAEVIGEVEKVIIKETTEPLELKQHEEKVTEDLVIVKAARIAVEYEVTVTAEQTHGPEISKLEEPTKNVQEHEQVVNLWAEHGSTQSCRKTALPTEDGQESVDMVFVEPDISTILFTQSADLKPLPPSNKPNEDKLLEKSCVESRENTDCPTDLTSVQSFIGPDESACLEPHNAGKRKKMGSTHSRTPRGIHTEEKPESWQEEVKDDAEVIGEVEKVIIKETTVPLELKQHEEKVTDDLMIEESACLEPHNAGKRKKMSSTRSRKPRGIHTEEKPESWQEEVKEDTEAIGEVEKIIIEETTESLELKQHEDKVTDDLMIDLHSVQSFVGPEEIACLESHNAGKRKKMGSTRSRTPRGIQREERPESWQEEVKEDTEAIGEVEKIIIEETTKSLELKQQEEKVTDDLMIGEAARIAVEYEVTVKALQTYGPEMSKLEEPTENVQEDEQVVNLWAEHGSTQSCRETAPLTEDGQESIDTVLIDSDTSSNLFTQRAGLEHLPPSDKPTEDKLFEKTCHESRENTDFPMDLTSVQSFVSLEESACLDPHNAKRRKKMGSTRNRKPQGKHREERLESWQDEVKEDAEVIEEVEQVIIEETTEPLELKQHEEKKVTDDLMIGEAARIVVEDEVTITKEQTCGPRKSLCLKNLQKN